MTEMSEVTSDQFKTVMRRFAASVNVITSSDGEVTSGMTATAVCSVSADPPSALIIVNRSNRSHPVISRSKAFAVNVLCTGQKDLANHFASRPSEPFAGIPHRSGKTGCPIIEGADAFIECLVFQEMDVGTHTIFLGRIVSTGTANSEPLLYHEGRYHGLSANA